MTTPNVVFRYLLPALLALGTMFGASAKEELPAVIKIYVEQNGDYTVEGKRVAKVELKTRLQSLKPKRGLFDVGIQSAPILAHDAKAAEASKAATGYAIKTATELGARVSAIRTEVF